MKNILLLLFLSHFLTGFNIYAQACKEIVGYYPGWQWYDRDKLVNPFSIDYSKYTIINYAFFEPNPDGTIIGADAWADENLLLGEINWSTSPPTYYPNTSLVDRAHNEDVKVLISVGGWTFSNNFPDIAADPEKRSVFASSCISLINQYNLDGIDIDWEYPGFEEHNGTPDDKENFTLLMQEIRDSLDFYDTSLLLTAAVGASADRMDDVDWDSISEILDIINVMSYDFFGSWDEETNHNAPLYAPNSGDPSFNLDSTITRLIDFYNVSSDKITAGLAFYGRSSKTQGDPGLHVPITNAVDNSIFWADEGSPLYYNVLLNQSLFTEYYDSSASVPYLLGNEDLNTFVSYDNEQSISEKAQYIVNKNLRGAIIWEITGDYIETEPNSGIIENTPLINTLNYIFCETIVDGCTDTTACNYDVDATEDDGSCSFPGDPCEFDNGTTGFYNDLCYCIEDTSSINEYSNHKALIKVIDLLGRDITVDSKQSTLLYIYDDGSVEKKYILK